MIRKIRLIRTLVVLLSSVFAIVLIAYLIGRGQTTPVIMISDDRLEPNKPLTEQGKYLVEKRISTKELEELGGQFVTDYNQLKGKKLKTAVKKNSPIPTYLLTSTKSAGQFASETAINHTLFKLPEGLKMLPPGIEEGDRISVKAIFQKGDDDKEKYIGEVVASAKVAGIQKEDILLYVNDDEFNRLSLMKEYSQFILTLPGVKNVGQCEDVVPKLKEDRDKAIEKLKESKSFKKESKSKQKDDIQAIKDKYTLRILNAECTKQGDKGSTTYSGDIKNQIIEKNKELEQGSIVDNTSDSEHEEETSKKEASNEN
ncbi:hypothetical protein [Bacillus cereus]|uniref:Uncharacterized protein n=1 Tax=Bacillus cereus TaxID=1396 RepID=A0A164QSQ7_BACCE|nr:hypothetical protein [Bacillus cereus]KZD72130.1 hypothetical protein B4088_0591 [Bacillus cereus]